MNTPQEELEHEFSSIEQFGKWLSQHQSTWFILPPTIVMNFEGNRRLAFVLRNGDHVAGICNTPLEALEAIGDHALMRAYLEISERVDYAATRVSSHAQC